jgi:hypothetical protein
MGPGSLGGKELCSDLLGGDLRYVETIAFVHREMKK